jgi:2-polyprenyl-6-methoxyphenol hydroxylase-like FAD-dependent oxidoreductase
MPTTEVLIAGAGPIGLTTAIELSRRGIDCRIIDPLLEPPQYAKAVGIQPRTAEVFEGMGVLRQVLDAAIQMRGQVVYVNGVKAGVMEIATPVDVPFGFISLPQYETERILRDQLFSLGKTVERGIGLAGFTQDDDGVDAVLTNGETVRAQYLVGCDGAHSIVRKTLGCTFEGGAFEESYMLGDVEVEGDWSQPRGWGIRSMHQTDGVTDDLLVCIPLPGHRRYRMSMLVPDDLLQATKPAEDKIEHGFGGAKKPELHHIQAVLDRLSPEPITATNLRWSSVFRISHRIVDSYGRGRAFIAGDAAHIHPPTGAQGMNTGIQDAHNLAWKLALAVKGNAAEGLLATYDFERRPIGEEVVGRTVRAAREGIGAGETDPDYIIRREAQLLIDYSGSPIVAKSPDAEPLPRAGSRAPDAVGLTRDMVNGTFRLFTQLGRVRHTVLVYADGSPLDVLESLAAAAVSAAHGEMDVYLVAAPNADVGDTILPLINDSDGDFARMYSAADRSVFVVRPDGYLGFARRDATTEALEEYLKSTFRS